MNPRQRPEPLETLHRKLLFVSGKGGVGKTTVSQAIAVHHAQRNRKTLWVTFQDPLLEPGSLKEMAPNLWHLNADAMLAFEEYAALKIGNNPLTRLFLQNRLVQYMAKAAPGIHELVLLGKVWHDIPNYDQLVVDMPSTGHGLAMFQSTKNFSALFQGGPIQRDAIGMISTFSDPSACGHLILALPEEMPLREALDLEALLLELFPENRPAFMVNRLFPTSSRHEASVGYSPVAKNAHEYIVRRNLLEAQNLTLWTDSLIPFLSLPYVSDPVRIELPKVIAELNEVHQ